MFDFFHFANLARKGWIKFGEGKIQITGIRTILFDVESLNALQAELEKIFGYNGCAHLLYRMSMRGGSRAARAHQKFSSYKEADLIDYLAKMATGAGWGKIIVEEENSGSWPIVVYNSPFAKRKKEAPSCHYLRGFLAGAASYIYKKRFDCIETECKSVGSRKCRFIIAKRNDLEKKEFKPFLNQVSDFDFEF